MAVTGLAACSGNDEEAEARKQALEEKRGQIVQKARDTAMGINPVRPERTEPEPEPAPPPLEPEMIEQRRKDVRVIDGIATPRLEGDRIARLPDLVRQNQKGPDPDTQPKKFALPLVKAAHLISSGETMIELAGIKALPADRQCEGAEGKWPCGNFAKAQLQRFIRRRTITCNPYEGSKDGKWIASCSAGQDDLAEWLVENGWAEAASEALKPLEQQARENQKGIWGNR